MQYNGESPVESLHEAISLWKVGFHVGLVNAHQFLDRKAVPQSDSNSLGTPCLLMSCSTNR